MRVQQLIATQIRVSRAIDRRLPEVFRRDGHQEYMEQLVDSNLAPGITIYDVGGGKRPYLTPDRKRTLEATVIGIDIDPLELERAPTGAYDQTITADIATFNGGGADTQPADLVICQAVFEHVADVPGATRAVAHSLKPGGKALLFVPCRNAIFARMNLLLPESLKRRVLFTIHPRMSAAQGFPSHYDHCTPSALAELARANGLEVMETRTYWRSDYFHAFVPAYLVWRAWTIVARSLGLHDCCETFTITLRKPPQSAPAD